jgi:RNA polymerase sigma-70 factor (ECF subfamily)
MLTIKEKQEKPNLIKFFDFDSSLLDIQNNIYSYILTLIPNRSDAKDILQEVNMIMINKKSSFDPNIGPLKAWAFTIAKYQVMAFRTSKGRSKVCFSNELSEALADEYVNSGMDEELTIAKKALEICFQHLPEHMKDIADLRFKQENSFKQISKKLGRSMGTVSATVSRIREKLVKCTRKKINEYKIYGEFTND